METHHCFEAIEDSYFSHRKLETDPEILKERLGRVIGVSDEILSILELLEPEH